MSILQELKIPSTIDTIYNAALLKLDYLGYSETAPLARKCIHVLGKFGTDEAKEKLKLLANSDCDIIKEYALHQLEK